jgi:hypothetical protein
MNSEVSKRVCTLKERVYRWAGWLLVGIVLALCGAGNLHTRHFLLFMLVLLALSTLSLVGITLSQKASLKSSARRVNE